MIWSLGLLVAVIAIITAWAVRVVWPLTNPDQDVLTKTDSVVGVKSGRGKKLEATAVRTQRLIVSRTLACAQCGAPGKFEDTYFVKDTWPACYDPAKKGQPVGDNCPQCGRQRPEDEPLGVVWEKQFLSDGSERVTRGAQR